jgi:peptidoglycan glycosyltransferase
MLADSRMLRGDIIERGGYVLATTETGDYNKRVYPYAREFAHPIGFSGYNSQGIESLYGVALLTVNNEIIQRINGLTSGSPIKGNTIVTTLDLTLQQKAYELLDGRKGAVIAIEPQTGKVLACVSSPSFNPNRTAMEWDSLKTDKENNLLLNRAAQGLYPPGSIFKIVTLVAAMRYMPDWEDFTYTCTGRETFDGKVLRCFNETAHGTIGYKDAFAKSCNTYFAMMGQTAGVKNVADTASALLFNDAYPSPVEYVESSFVLNDEAPIAEIVETMIGQGKTLVTPLHMAMLTCAIANDGRLMKPYIVDRTENVSGKTLKKNLPKIGKTLFTSEEAQLLTEVMSKVSADGTARQLDKSLNIAGKTGSAENSSGLDHGWFIGIAPADNPKIAIAVILENCGGSSVVLPIVEEIIQLALY